MREHSWERGVVGSVDGRHWLESLGLGEYARAFEKNHLDWALLPELDHQILRDIVLASAGHRLRLLWTAQALRSGPESDNSEVWPAASPQRHQLTVMLADLAGSTELSRRLDPENLREGNRADQNAAKAAVERFDGFVARYMGGGVLAYFGYPQAREDDAVRAVHAGLELASAVRALEAGTPLAVRVGIATGPVVVGDLIGERASQQSAVGATARLRRSPTGARYTVDGGRTAAPFARHPPPRTLLPEQPRPSVGMPHRAEW